MLKNDITSQESINKIYQDFASSIRSEMKSALKSLYEGVQCCIRLNGLIYKLVLCRLQIKTGMQFIKNIIQFLHKRLSI